MADKELWEIELEFKTAKIEAAQEKYNKFVKAREDGEKRIDDLGKKLNAAGRNDYKLAQEQSKAFEQARREDKKRTAALDNEYAKQQIANINRIADAQKRVESIAADRLRKAAKQNEFNSQFKGQTSGIENYGITNLNGQIGSQSYVNMLKSIRSELNPTSAEFQQLSNSIKQYQAEIDKVNKSSGIQSFKSLTLAIKETKGELARLAAEQKVGTAEWQKYSDKLRELQRQKQLIQRETKLTSQQLLAMSRDFTVVSFGVRQVITDIAGLSDGKKSAGELAMAISGIGLQVLTILPAIHGLTKALEAAGLVSTATIAKLGSMASTLGVLAAGIASVTAAYGMMSGAVTHLTDITGRLGSVLSGQMSYWDALKANLRDVTFGLIDMVEQTDNATRSLEQLMQLSVVSGKQFQNTLDFQNYEAKFKPGGEFYGKYNNDEIKSLIENYKALQNVETEYQQEQQRLDQYNKNKTDLFYEESKKKTKKSGSPKTTKEEKQEELNLIKLQQDEYSKLQSKYDKNLGDLGAQNDLRLKMLNIEREIFRLRYGADVSFKNLPEGTSLDNIISGYVNTHGLIKRPGMKFTSLNAGDNRPDMTSEEMKTIADEMKRKEEGRLGVVNQMYESTKGMLSDFGLMKGTTAEIVNFLDSLISGASKGFSLISSLIGFVTNPIGTIISTASGGGGFNGAGHATGMGYNGGSMPNIGMPNNKPLVAPVIIKNPISLGKGMEVINNYDATRGTIDI